MVCPFCVHATAIPPPGRDWTRYMNNIREYLCAEAAKITDAAGKRFKSKKDLLAARPKLLKQYLEMMSILEFPPEEERTPLNVKVTGKAEYPAYTIERLYYESLPRLYVPGNLYVPKKTKFPAPAVAYFCGHSPTMRHHYQVHPRRWAELGFVTLVVDTIEYGEMRGTHHAGSENGWFNWFSRGFTPGGVEMWNGLRAVDLLRTRKEVAGDRIGVTGISGGGAMSWWLAAADERVKASAPVCGTGALRSHLAERTVDCHCDCMFFINYYGWDLADLGALIAPRPLLICSADHDPIYSIESIRECYKRAKVAYDLLGASGNIGLVETPGPHSYHEKSRKAIFSWFFKHLCGKDVPPDEIGDCDPCDKDPAPKEHLIVWPERPPADERSSVVHEWFVPRAETPNIKTIGDLKTTRARIARQLRATGFNHFPAKPCPLDFRIEQECEGPPLERRFSFAPEDGWRLHGRFAMPEPTRKAPAPALIYANIHGLVRWQGSKLWEGFDPSWLRMGFEPRGIYETSWHDDMAWHVRRGCAVTGRTLLSMRVYDVLRAVEVARRLPECNGTIALAGEGEMAAATLYAALLDGDIRAVVLKNPPATHDAPTNKEGIGAALEMLGVLRFTDLPVTAGLLYPTELVFVGLRPQEYQWTEELYARLGAPGRITHVRQLREWYPEHIR